MIDLTAGNKAARVIYCLMTHEFPTSRTIAEATDMSVPTVKNVISEVCQPFPYGFGMNIHWVIDRPVEQRHYTILDFGVLNKKDIKDAARA